MNAWAAQASANAAAAIVALGLGVAPTAAATTPTNPCASAQALARSGRAVDAQKAYLALFAEKPVPTCARSGLLRLRRREISTAGALIHAGFRAEALKQIELAREALPAASLPVELRRFLVAERTFDRVRTLKKAGLEGAAEQTLRRFLRDRPRSGATPAGGIPADMRPLLDQEQYGVFRRLHDWISRQFDSEMLLWTAWAFVALLGAFFVFYELRRSLKHRLSILEFEGTGESNGTAQYGKGLALELQERCQNLGAQYGGTRPDLKLPDKADTLEMPGAVTDVMPQLKWVGAALAVIERFVPTKACMLKGYLQPSNGSGVGLSLTLAGQRGGIKSQITLREADYGLVSKTVDGQQYYTLLTPATYWLLDTWNGDDGGGGVPRWKANALVAAGVRAQEKAADLRTARRLFTEALRHQPPVVGALLNLGALEIKEGSATDPIDINEIMEGVEHMLAAVKAL